MAIRNDEMKAIAVRMAKGFLLATKIKPVGDRYIYICCYNHIGAGHKPDCIVFEAQALLESEDE